eukprot:gnl/Chilomastix_cuspidata/2285.p1 GENE.gnl/Chilomastix_cuspidata/2285~~gnl/Chilomastix_cuspidata/2285.p1  ORF type:complete len:290 (+),score=47.25 gnl/Chilomastix_cuspidata/2285:75-872(+)
MESGRKKYRSTNNLLEDIPSAEAIRARYGLVLPSLVKEPKIRKKKSCQSLDKRVTESINSQTLGDSTHLKTAFKKYDPKKTGTVNEAQFSRAVREAGASLNAQEMDYILTRARRPGSGRVDYKGFVKKVGYRRRARATPEQKAEQARLRRLQIAFSRKADLSGKPLPQLFTSFGHNLDNTISEKDFIKGARTRYLFAPHAFVPQCQLQFSKLPSQSGFCVISKHFTATLHIPLTSTVLKPTSFNGSSTVKRQDFTTDLIGHLRTL